MERCKKMQPAYWSKVSAYARRATAICPEGCCCRPDERQGGRPRWRQRCAKVAGVEHRFAGQHASAAASHSINAAGTAVVLGRGLAAGEPVHGLLRQKARHSHDLSRHQGGSGRPTQPRGPKSDADKGLSCPLIGSCFHPGSKLTTHKSGVMSNI